MDTLGYLVPLLIVFGGVISLFAGVSYLSAGRTDVVKDRIRRVVGRKETASDVEVRNAGLLASAFQPLAKAATPTNENELGQIKARLVHAGFRSSHAQSIYLGSKVLLCLLFCGSFLLINSLKPQELPNALFFTLLLMTIGFYMPNLWLHGRIQERHRELSRGLPDALDLLVTCVEAGLGLDAALNRVAAEVAMSTPVIALELATTSAEIRAGVPRADGFRRLAERTGLEELRSLSAIIVQTQLFGTSIAKSLRTQADSMRIRRMQKAEEKAATVAVKMTVPMILCIMPALFAVLLGPAVVNVMRTLMPALGGK
jgi:tight adherence protein C